MRSFENGIDGMLISKTQKIKSINYILIIIWLVVFISISSSISSSISYDAFKNIVNNEFTDYDYEILYNYSHYKLIRTIGRNHHYNGACLLSNGDYLVVAQNSTSHVGPLNTSKISSWRSMDCGLTWSYNGDIYNGNPIYGANGATIGTAPNGDIICFFQRIELTEPLKVSIQKFIPVDFPELSPKFKYRLMYTQSFDFGYSWTSPKYLNETCNDSGGCPSHFVIKNNTIYYVILSAYTNPNYNDIYVSNDNGSIWTKRSRVQTTEVEAYGTIDVLPNGSFLFIDHRIEDSNSYYRYSHDDCYSWSKEKKMYYGDYPIYCRDPDLYIFVDNESIIHYILHGRLKIKNSTYYFGFYHTTNLSNWEEKNFLVYCKSLGGYSSLIIEQNNSFYFIFSKVFKTILADLNWIRLNKIPLTE